MRLKFTSRQLWNAFFSLVAFFGTTLGIYTFFFQEKITKVEYEILANTNVLDINADISKLDILYDKNSLKINNQSLRIITLRIRNTGNECILKNYYDNNDPLGLIIDEGKIIEKPELIFSSNSYIAKNLKIKIDSSGNLNFSDVILEPNDFYNIKLLILHSNTKQPKISSKGKIAGIKEIPVTSLIQDVKAEKSFLHTTYNGNIFSQLLRLATYGLLAIIFLIFFTFAGEEMAVRISNGKRKGIIESFKRQGNYRYNKSDEIIFSLYQNGAEIMLKFYQKLLKNEDEINEKYNIVFNTEILKNYSATENENRLHARNNDWFTIYEMLRKGFLYWKDGKLAIDLNLKNKLDEFLTYLSEKK